MKIQVIHDKAGKIHCIFAPVEGRRRGYISSPDTNMTVVEVEAPKSLSSLRADQNEDIAAALDSLMRDFVVESGSLARISH